MCTTVFLSLCCRLSEMSSSSALSLPVLHFFFFYNSSFWSRTTHFFSSSAWKAAEPSQWLCGRAHYMGNGTVTFPIWRDSIVGMWTHLDSKPWVWEMLKSKGKEYYYFFSSSSSPRWTFFVRFGGDHLLCVPLCPKSSIVLKVSFKQYRFAPQ